MAAAEGSAELLVVGRFGTPHGIAGWLRIASFTHPEDNIAGYRPWLVEEADGHRPVEITGFEARGSRLVVRLAGIEDRDQAARLTGRDIFVPRSALPEPADPDEFYWRDLVGLEVVNHDGTSLGRVRTLLDTAAHAVLVIDGPQGEKLIPFLAVFVRDVRREQGRIEVSWREPV